METSKKRLLSLDVLRGITVAGMILVNNPGGPAFAPLKHASWNGLTPCDLVFPFFLFIMGVSAYISLNKFHFQPSAGVVRKIVKRTLLIILVGWAIHWTAYACGGDFFPFDHLRLPGVLPRIGLCYGIVSLLALFVPHKRLPLLAVLLLVAYAFLLCLGNGYACDDTNLLVSIDKAVFGEAHLYRWSPVEPEGLGSTIPSIAHTLIGFLCGKSLMGIRETDRKIIRLFVTGFLLMASGFLLSYGLPINKSIWSPSFVLTTCGLASLLLATLMYFIDMQGKQQWCKFFVVFGMNPLFLYVASEIGAILFGTFGVKGAVCSVINAIVPSVCLASLTYALCYLLLLGAMGGVLYRKKIFIKL